MTFLLNAEEPITTIGEIQAMSEAKARSKLPVKIRCSVTFSSPRALSLFVHDGQNGIFVNLKPLENPTWPQVGDQVIVTGVTGHGIFSPIIDATPSPKPTVQIQSRGNLPAPKTLTGIELAKPEADCEWVSVDADVTDVVMDGEDLVIICRSGSVDFYVILVGPLPPNHNLPVDIADKRIRIHGVVATIFNSNGQMTRRILRVSNAQDITVLPSSDQHAEAKLVKSSELLKINGPSMDDQVKVQGVVTFDLQGRGLFLRTDEGGLWVQTARSPHTEPGDLVEVEGLPRAGTIRPYIHAVAVRVLGKQQVPIPILNRGQTLLSASFDSELVSTKAELINTFHGADGTTFEFRDGSVIFRGFLERDSMPSPQWDVGAIMQVSGIAQITASREYSPLQEEDKLLIRLRTPHDLVLLQSPPWWTPRRLAWAIAAILLTFAAIYQFTRLRRKRLLEAQRREFEVILAERGRFARDIHDSLAQGLTSVSMQLECVRNSITSAPTSAAAHLETARELVRESMKEARRTIWNLRPLALHETDLATTLHKYAQDLTRDSNIIFRQSIEGSPSPLSQELENALLRICQEALTNAVRHASPQRIEMRLRYGMNWITLMIKDNGRGFDVANRMGKGYGLTGIRERIEALRGSLSIDSHAGEGTEVSVTLPL